MFDKNSDGFITKKELGQVMQSIGIFGQEGDIVT